MQNVSPHIPLSLSFRFEDADRVHFRQIYVNVMNPMQFVQEIGS
jgi:hypothetical protein